jgi:excinuclease UvrABC nuclease subunit
LSAIKNATEAEISAVKGISKADAQRVWEYFQGKDKK